MRRICPQIWCWDRLQHLHHAQAKLKAAMEHAVPLLQLPKPASGQQVAKTLQTDGWGTGRWTIVLQGTAKSDRPDLTSHLLALMQSRALQADVFHYSAAMSGPGDLWPFAMSLLQKAEDSGISPNEYTFGSAMRGLGHWLLGLHCLRSMGRIRLHANNVILTTLINTHSNQHQWKRALEIHGLKSEATSFMSAAAMSACEKCSEWRHSLELFNPLSAVSARSLTVPQEGRALRDLVCYGSALGACSQGQRWQAAAGLLEQMAMDSVRCNTMCYNAAMSSCADRWEVALSLFGCLCRTMSTLRGHVLL